MSRIHRIRQASSTIRCITSVLNNPNTTEKEGVIRALEEYKELRAKLIEDYRVELTTKRGSDL